MKRGSILVSMRSGILKRHKEIKRQRKLMSMSPKSITIPINNNTNHFLLRIVFTELQKYHKPKTKYKQKYHLSPIYF